MRYTALDGLRGIAALVVAIHHTLLTVAVLSAPYFSDAAVGTPHGLAWWMTYTPLHLVWEGTAAVYVFFVLSGFVLTLPVLGKSYDWLAYYPMRLIRLYLPVWGAVIFALVTIFVVHRTTDPGSLWLQLHPKDVGRLAVAEDVTLVPGAGWTASPLWSLTWEILFSLILPIVVWVAVKLRRAHLLVLIAAIAASTLGAVLDERWLQCMPMFVVGVIIAMNRETIRVLAASLSTAGWIGLASLAAIALTSRWIVIALGAPPQVASATSGLALVGAALLVIMALEWPMARSALETAPLRMLGRLSFSLYLVHEPIVVAAGFAFPDEPFIAIPVALAAIAIVTPLFFVAVERPSHRLARSVGHAVRTRRAKAVESAEHLDSKPDLPDAAAS